MLFQKLPTVKAVPDIVAAPPPMPNVFVTPPEEEDAPTWCFFDAANPSFSQVIDKERSEPAPVFNEDNRFYYSVWEESHASSGMKTSIVDAAIGKRSLVEVADGDGGGDDDGDLDLETISDYGHELDEEATSRDVANDSDVVEVVKVRRRMTNCQEDDELPVEQEPVPIPTKSAKPKSLKSRASSAFKSLKGSFRSKRQRDTISLASSSRSSRDRQSVDQPPVVQPAPVSKSLRRSSRILSHLFKSTSSVDVDGDVDVPRSSIAQLNAASASSPSHQEQEQLRLSASSPTPSTASRFSSRFSRLSLRNLFSFDDAYGESSPQEGPETPVLSSVPTAYSVPFSASSSTTSPVWPETPMSTEFQVTPPLPSIVDSVNFEQTNNLDLGIGLGLIINPIKANSNSSHTSASTPTSPPTTPRKSTSSLFTSSSISTSPPRKSSSTIGSVWSSITPKVQHRSKSFTSATATMSSPRTSFISMGVLDEDADQELDRLEDGDTSLEMRLDSLHFDSISFDVDKFNLR